MLISRVKALIMLHVILISDPRCTMCQGNICKHSLLIDRYLTRCMTTEKMIDNVEILNQLFIRHPPFACMLFLLGIEKRVE